MEYVLLSAVVLSAAAYLCVRLVVTAPSSPKIIRVIVEGAAEAAAASIAGATLPQPPEDVLAFIAAEGEEWLRLELLQRAHVLFREQEDWALVLQTLKNEAS
jgi:hypothetical protein